MSVKHLVYVFEDEELKGADRLMMLAIADYCDEHGACYPSYSRLAKKCNVKRRSAIDTCNRLIEKGHLGVKLHAGIETQNGKTNRFYMTKWRDEQGLSNDFLDKYNAVNNTGAVDNTPSSAVDNTPSSAVGNTLTVGNRSLTVDVPPDKSGGADANEKPSAFFRSKRFSDIALSVISPAVFNMPADLIKQSKNFVAFNMVNGLRDAYETINPDVDAEALTRDVEGFIKFWRSSKQGADIPRQRDKFTLHFMTFLNTRQTSPVAEVKHPTETELIIRAQIELGYDVLNPSNITDDVRMKIKELKQTI
jgi:hypothetical protein